MSVTGSNIQGNTHFNEMASAQRCSQHTNTIKQILHVSNQPIKPSINETVDKFKQRQLKVVVVVRPMSVDIVRASSAYCETRDHNKVKSIEEVQYCQGKPLRLCTSCSSDPRQ